MGCFSLRTARHRLQCTFMHTAALKRETLDLYWNETDPLTAAVGVTG